MNNDTLTAFAAESGLHGDGSWDPIEDAEGWWTNERERRTVLSRDIVTLDDSDPRGVVTVEVVRYDTITLDDTTQTPVAVRHQCGVYLEGDGLASPAVALRLADILTTAALAAGRVA